MKKRYKFLLVIFLLWLGMSYEGSRGDVQSTRNRPNVSLQDQIALYEAGLLDGLMHEPLSEDDRAGVLGRGAAYEGNFFTYSSRRIGDALQMVVRETLRGFVRFFDGIIS